MGSSAELLEKWLLMCSNSRHVLVYKGVSTEWASQWTHVPIYISTIAVETTKGMMVVLSDQGNLSVTYLGTQGSAHQLSLGQTKQVSFEKIESENVRLRAMIEKYEKEGPQTAGAKEGGKGILGVKLQVMGCAETSEYVEDPEGVLAKGMNGAVLEVSCRLILSVSSTTERNLKNVSVNIVPPKGVRIEQPYMTFQNLKSETPLIVPIFFRATNNTFPFSRKLSIYASYQVSGTTASRITCEEAELPLSLFSVPIASPKQLKEAQFKATLIVTGKDKAVPPLATLFQEFVESNSQYGEIISANPGVVAFKYHNGFEFGILLAKSGGKYRVQCSRFEGLWFVLSNMLSLLDGCMALVITRYR